MLEEFKQLVNFQYSFLEIHARKLSKEELLNAFNTLFLRFSPDPFLNKWVIIFQYSFLEILVMQKLLALAKKYSFQYSFLEIHDIAKYGTLNPPVTFNTLFLRFVLKHIINKARSVLSTFNTLFLRFITYGKANRRRSKTFNTLFLRFNYKK